MRVLLSQLPQDLREMCQGEVEASFRTITNFVHDLMSFPLVFLGISEKLIGYVGGFF
jgi:hypothetical protein